MWSRNHGGALEDTDPAFGYQVLDESGRTAGYITKLRASGLAPSWRISLLDANGQLGDARGDYASPEEAFAAMRFFLPGARNKRV